MMLNQSSDNCDQISREMIQMGQFQGQFMAIYTMDACSLYSWRYLTHMINVFLSYFGR